MGSHCAIVSAQWVVERAIDTAEPSCSINVVEERAEGVGRVQKGGELASRVAEGAEVDCAVEGVRGAGEEVVGDGPGGFAARRTGRAKHLANPGEVCLQGNVVST